MGPLLAWHFIKKITPASRPLGFKNFAVNTGAA